MFGGCDSTPLLRWTCLVLCRYTWEIYARRLLDLSSVYSFWKHVSNLDRSETKRYLEMLYVLRLRPLIEKVRSRTGPRGRVDEQVVLIHAA